MRDFRTHIGRRVLVITTSGLTFDGTLTGATKTTLELDHAAVTQGPGSNGVAVDGVVVVPGQSVDWVQVP